MAPEVRLHLGCGPRHLPGRLNLDAAPDAPGADLRARAECLPFADETVHTIEAYHLLEHLGWLGAHDSLAEAYRVLRPGGRLVLETPDPAASCRRFLTAQTREDRAAALNWLYGHEQPPGLLHRFLFPRDALAELLTRQGFAALCWPPPRTHRYAPGLRVEAVRGDDPVHLALARLRGQIRAHDLLAGLDMVARLEFAAVVDGGVEQALRRAVGSPHDHRPAGAPLPDPFRTILADLLPALLLCPDAVALLDPALPRLRPLPPPIPRRVPRRYLEGFVSAYMIPLHGLGILFLFEPGAELIAPLPFPARFVVYAAGITACEIGWGFLLDKTLGFFPWDYYAMSKWRIGQRGYSLWTLVPMWGLAGLLLERYTSLMLHLSPHVVSYYGF